MGGVTFATGLARSILSTPAKTTIASKPRAQASEQLQVLRLLAALGVARIRWERISRQKQSEQPDEARMLAQAARLS